MRVAVAVVGRPRTPGLADIIREYEQRASRYWSFDVVEVREEPARSASADLVRRREGDRLLDRIASRARVVTCEIEGKAMSSQEFADWMGRCRDRAQDLAFVIGGAFGLSEAVRSRADTRLSLSRYTLPHEFARLVLAEQIYRAGSILRGEPYHK
jgi:23S rRNA (pseudouridine1915-N3)-methyltransferase